MRARIASATWLVAHWRERLLDLLFPVRCVNCRRFGEPFCPDCRSQIHFVVPPFCARCGSSLIRPRQACTRCQLYPLHLDHVRAVAYHEGVIREAIHALKYGHRQDLAPPLADLLQKRLQATHLAPDVITAVPLHPERQRERGYNQAELLARELARRVSLPYVECLERLRPTADQVGLDASARHANLLGAFGMCRGIRGERVLLIDDVFTTGATIDACGVALRAGGAARLYALTVGRAR